MIAVVSRRDDRRGLSSWWLFAGAFVALSYAWSWLIWLSTLRLTGAIDDNAIILGTFGPSVGGLALLALLSRGHAGSRFDWIPGFLFSILIAAVALVIKHYASVNENWGLYPPGYDDYRLDGSLPSIAWSVAICLTSGVLFASARSSRELVRSHLRNLLPNRRFVVWLFPVLVFFPLLFLSSNGVAQGLGLPLLHQRYADASLVAVIAVMLVQVVKVAALTGGNEEAGWRGILLPTMQRFMSPLEAALLIGLIWELWHLPLVFGGVYGDAGIVETFILRLRLTILLSILLTALYNRTRGNVLLCVVLHGAYNVQQTMFAASRLAFITGLLVIVFIIFHERMWRRGNGHEVSPLLDQRAANL